MEWNWCWNGNDMTAFMLYESSGDSEEVKLNGQLYRCCHDDEVTMNEYKEEEGASFRNDDHVEDHLAMDDDDDDAQSCSYDHHSSYVNISTYGNTHHHHEDHSSQRLYINVSDDVDDHDDDDDYGDDDYKNWGESKLMDPSKKQNRSHKFCGDSLNQRDADKLFWETCLAS